MRKIVLGLAITLDGLIEGPNGEYDWCFTDQDYGMKEFLESIDAVFYGRKSYELMMNWEGGNPFANKKSYVFSHSWTDGHNNFEVVSGDVIAKVKALKEAKGKDIWLFGGASLTTFLMNHGLVDQLWLSVHPIILGKGKPLFVELVNRTKLELMETKPYETGLLSLRYRIVV
jgi:dihydrofolate reductase